MHGCKGMGWGDDVKEDEAEATPNEVLLKPCAFFVSPHSPHFDSFFSIFAPRSRKALSMTLAYQGHANSSVSLVFSLCAVCRTYDNILHALADSFPNVLTLLNGNKNKLYNIFAKV